MDLVGTQLPGLNDLLNLDDSDLAAGRRQRIEVLGGIAIHHVAITVGLPALDDGEVGAEGCLEDIRSEERRVGKEWRRQWQREHYVSNHCNMIVSRRASDDVLRNINKVM